MSPWVLPIMALVVTVAWVLWLARGTSFTEDAAPLQPQSSQTSAQHEPSTATKDVPVPVEKASRAPAAAPVKAAAPASEPALQLSIQAPVRATVGEGFDVRVSLAARRPVKRIAVAISYDPALLKARTAEEIDYSQRGATERAFRIEQAVDGEIEVALGDEPGTAGRDLPMSAALVQFEPLAPGRTQVRVTGITVLDPSDRSLQFAATGKDSEIIIR